MMRKLCLVFLVSALFSFNECGGETFREFIEIPEMRMDEYNFWHRTNDVYECAQKCLEERRIECRSFSFSVHAPSPGCGLYEKARDDALPGVYTGNNPRDSAIVEGWTYYEKKTNSYKELEKKMAFLENISDIDSTRAGNFLDSLNDNLMTSLDISDDAGSGTSSADGISTAELSIISDMIQKIAELNPIKTANLQETASFVGNIMRISSTMVTPSLKEKWLRMQQVGKLVSMFL